MKKLYYSGILYLLSLVTGEVFSQCTPVNCLGSLPPYGGICDTEIMDGRVNQSYYDSVSFAVTNVCVDAGTLDPQYAGIGAKLLKLHTISYSGFPAGLTGTTNQTQYIAPAFGCGSISGTPAEAGIFNVTINILANIRTWPFSTTCSGFFPIDQNNQPFSGSFSLIILPDPGFSGIDSNYCFQDPPDTLTPTGTTGGIFTGPGVTGNTFDPSLAGPGTHDIKYIVTAQQGSAVAPTTDSSVFTVVVTSGNIYFEDADGDGFGNPDSTLAACYLPVGYSANNLDCNDTAAAINPNTHWFADMDGDHYISDTDSVMACIQPVNYILPSSSLGTDCDDNDSLVGPAATYYLDFDNDSYGNPYVTALSCIQPVGYVSNNLDCNDTNYSINPVAIDIPDNGIDEDCSGYDSTTAGIHEISADKFRIYPNPANDHLIIENSTNAKDAVVYIYSLQGILIFKQDLQKARTEIVTRHFAKGACFVRLIGPNINVVKKIVME